MSIEKYEFSPLLGIAAGKMMEEHTYNILLIKIGLHDEQGIVVQVGAEGGTVNAVSKFMGAGWLEQFASEVGDILSHNEALNTLLKKRTGEIITTVGKAMEEAGLL